MHGTFSDKAAVAIAFSHGSFIMLGGLGRTRSSRVRCNDEKEIRCSQVCQQRPSPSRDLFSSPFHFSVPRYQRPYSWTTAEAGQLLDDVLAAAGIGGDPAAAEPDYFLGAILLLDGRGGDLPKAREREPRMFEIVDGQQRLVTLAILAAVLRDLATERWRWGGRNRLDQLVAADTAATRLKGVRFRIELRAQRAGFLGNQCANARRLRVCAAG